MIRKTLAHTKTATYSVGMLRSEQNEGVLPVGTGFFVGPGLFATANHVIASGGQPHSVITEEAVGVHAASMRIADVLFTDADADFALLRVALSLDQQKVLELPAPLKVSTRLLEEGEPVYSFGYPLAQLRAPLRFSLKEARRFGLPVDDLVGEAGEPLTDYDIDEDRPIFALMTHNLSPRTTSAVVASRREYFSLIGDLSADALGPRADERDKFYVTDKALNYGNSGGPIVATETGKVHAVCTKFQPVSVPQVDGGSVMIPSLYGVVTRLSFAPILEVLRAHGVVTTDD
jgi:serine protease Do